MPIQIKINIYIVALSGMVLALPSCKKFIQTEAPKTELIKETVFSSDATAKGAIAGLYSQLIESGYASGDIGSVGYSCAASSDELVPTSNSTSSEFYNHTLVPISGGLSALWDRPYLTIYTANALIEGLEKSASVTASLRQQLEGEAKFIRAFAHFYLVNLFGEVPIVLTTDYKINSNIPKSSKADVYAQIISDLMDAQTLLAADYDFSLGERTRPNQWTAAALLARVYLYNEQWLKAEEYSTAVINQTGLYSLPPLNEVYLKNSPEAIWQLSRDDGSPYDALLFPIPESGAPVASYSLRPAIVESFEADDLRKSFWIQSYSFESAVFYFPTKYHPYVISPITEYSMVMRLAEQYLIRAEARAQQDNITGANSAETDLNIIRERAGLIGVAGTSKSVMLSNIETERLHELFTEWGHRWFDLKRTARINDVLQPIKPNWESFRQLFPIPQPQMLNDPSIKQNPGY
jgi:hypothetical protein